MIIRLLTENDRDMLANWIASEPDHAGSSADYYFQPNTTSVVYEDEHGPLFVVRYSSVLKLDIDFNKEAGRQRIGQAMKSGLPEVVGQAKARGFSEIMFDSKSAPLIGFCEKLGFVKSANDFRKVV